MIAFGNQLANFATIYPLTTMSDLPEFTVKVTPFGDHIAVVPEEMETQTASGIYIPDTAKGEKSAIGIVIAVGDGEGQDDEKNPSKYFKIGEKVVFGKYSGEDIELTTKEGKKKEVKFLSIDSVRAKIA